MSLETVMQRLQEIQSLVGPASVPAVTQTAAANASSSPAFAAMLASAQTSRDPSASASASASANIDAAASPSSDLPGNSLASGLPQLTTPAMLAAYGGATPGASASPYGAVTYPEAGATAGSLASSIDAVGMTPYLSSPIGGVTFPWTGSGDVGRRMVALAQGEVGVRENGSSNDGERIATYRSATEGAAAKPGPWCAYFVSWLARQSGAPIGPNGAGMGYVPALESWGRSTGRFVEPGAAAPKPGDIVVFDWGHDGTADHTGIVERVDPSGTIHTIEGNSSNMVARRDYAAGSTSIRGYVHPG